MRAFLDSSALAKRYIEEPGSDVVERVLREASALGVAVLCLPEVASALNRRKRHRSLTPRLYRTAMAALLRDLEDADVVQLTPVVVGRAVGLLEEYDLRALDALHVACALEWRAELFVSADRKQLQAASASGLEARRV